MNSSSNNIYPLAKEIDFDKLDQLKYAYHTWIIKQIFEFKIIRINKIRYEIAYKGNNCLWHLSAWSIDRSEDFFRIKSRVGKESSQLGEHHERAEQSRAESSKMWREPSRGQGIGSARKSENQLENRAASRARGRLVARGNSVAYISKKSLLKYFIYILNIIFHIIK